MSDQSDRAVLEEVLELLRDRASLFDTALVNGPVPEGGGMRIELTCSTPQTARLVLYPSNESIDVNVGETAWVELPKRRKTHAKRMEELQRILDAVVAGRFEETTWRMGDRIVRSKAVFCDADGKAFLRSREWQGIANLIPDPRATRTDIRYQPYS